MAPPARSRWSLEALDVLERRAALLWTVIGGVVVVAAVAALVAPDLLAPRPIVGAAVGLAAVLLGVAVVTAIDAGDAVVRGPRHVRAAGGELVGVLPDRVAAEGARELAAAVLDARPDRRLTLGIAGAQASTPTSAWANALATALAEHGASVLTVDLADGATPQDGILEVLDGERPLARAVDLHPELKLASIGAGRDLDAALRAAVDLPNRLPRDLEVLLVALPPIAAGDVLAAATALDAVLVLALSDRTRRARLQAAIEAIEAGGTAAQVVLVDDGLAATARSSGAAPRPSDGGRRSTDTPPADAAPPTRDAEAADRDAGPEDGDDGAGSDAAAMAPPAGDQRAPVDVDVPAADREPPTSDPRDAAGGDGPPAGDDPPEGGPPPGGDGPSEGGGPPEGGDPPAPAGPRSDGGAAAAPGEPDPPPRVDLSAVPRPSVRLVRDVAPSPRRPLRPDPVVPVRAEEAADADHPTAERPEIVDAPPPESIDPSSALLSPEDRTDQGDDGVAQTSDEAVTDDGDVGPLVTARDVDMLRVSSRVSALTTVMARADAEPDDPDPAPAPSDGADGPPPPGGDAPVDQAPVDEAPVDEAPVDDAPPEGALADDAPVEGALDDDALAEDVPDGAPDGDAPLRGEPTAAPDAPADAAAEVLAAPETAREVVPEGPFEGVDTDRLSTDTTGELPRTMRGDEQDDPLRTTAQLALLLDQIEDREASDES